MSNQNTNQLNVERENINNATIRILLDFYLTLHNQTTRRIDSLYDILDEIRQAINILGGINLHNGNAHRNPNINSTFYTNNTRENFRGRGRYNNNNNRTTGGRNNMWSNRTQNWYSQQPNNFESLYNNRIYIEGRPYRLEFDRYTIPMARDANRHAGSENDLLNFIQNFYSNVPVVATPTQIQNATRVVQFSEIDNPINNSCPITLEPFTNESTVTQILGCNHLFNPESFNSWFETNVRCPVCRYDIRTNAVDSRRQNEESKEESELEETKEDSPSFQPFNSSRERPVERNSNLRRPIRIQTHPTIDLSSNNVLESVFTEITGTLLNQFLNPTQRDTANRLFFNNSLDASNNEIIFRGFRT